MDKVIVTGGSGLLGKALKQIKPEWRYLNSAMFDLRKESEVIRMYEAETPDIVLHLAGRVGGIKANTENAGAFFYDNVMMNTLIIHYAKEFKVKKLLASMSTCAFPNSVEAYPFTETALYSGPPATSNFAYGYAKRMIDVQIRSYRDQYKVNFISAAPSNVYGPGDNFESEDSHFIAALIRKMHHAKVNHLPAIEFWGTGRPLRQHLLVNDAASILIRLLEKYNEPETVIIAPDEQLSIKEIIELAKSVIDYDGEIDFNGKLDGQYRKDGSNEKLLKYIQPFSFTGMKEGLAATYQWYLENYQTIGRENSVMLST